MTTTMKILFGLFILAFWACSNSTTQQDGSAIVKKSDDNYSSNLISVDGKYQIDTNAILNNNNLKQLIDDLERADLKEKKTIAEIPTFIKLFLDSLTDNFSIANPGEDWRVGCIVPMEIDNSTQKKSVDSKTGDTVITVSMKTKHVPTRQLIYFGIGSNIALMTYYTGGIGKSEHILIFKFNSNEIVDFWCGNILTDVNNKTEILKFLKDNKKKDWGLNTNIIYL